MTIKSTLKKFVPTNDKLRSRMLIVAGTLVGLTLAATVLSKTKPSVHGDVYVVDGDVNIDATDAPEATTSTD